LDLRFFNVQMIRLQLFTKFFLCQNRNSDLDKQKMKSSFRISVKLQIRIQLNKAITIYNTKKRDSDYISILPIKIIWSRSDCKSGLWDIINKKTVPYIFRIDVRYICLQPPMGGKKSAKYTVKNLLLKMSGRR
jgi:hypothetical protein